MNTPTEHGELLSEVIELTLAALERTAPTTRTIEICGIAEAIIEGAGGADPNWTRKDWQAVYRAVEQGSQRYREAVRAYEAQRKLGEAA